MKKLPDSIKRHAGVENDGEFYVENGVAARSFNGQYTIYEIESLLIDMRCVQKVLNAQIQFEALLPRLPANEYADRE